MIAVLFSDLYADSISFRIRLSTALYANCLQRAPQAVRRRAHQRWSARHRLALAARPGYQLGWWAPYSSLVHPPPDNIPKIVLEGGWGGLHDPTRTMSCHSGEV